MKNYGLYIAVLTCAAIALAGCSKNEWMTGQTIRFGAATQGEDLTKTAYGKVVEGTAKKQMVDWKENDVIRIACGKASTAEKGTSTSADYKTSAGQQYGTTAESRATLSLASNNDKGLRWGSENDTHVFYAVYPSPQVKSGTILTDAGSFTGIIPESQKVVSISSASPYTAVPDMTNQYMLAKKTMTAGDQEIAEDEVLLYFSPVTTAIEFEVTNSMSAALDISSIEVISNAAAPSSGKNLSGTFSNTALGTALNETGLYSGNSYPAFTAGTGAGNSAKITFAGLDLTDDVLPLAVGEKLTFTIFLLPESDLNDLTFRINKQSGGYIQTALKHVLTGATDATFIEFARCKKHFVRGLFVNEGAKWELCFAPGVGNWTDVQTGKELQNPDFIAGEPSLVSWDPEGDEADLALKKPAEFKFSLPTGSATQTFATPGESGFESKSITVTSTKDGASAGWKIKSVGGVTVNGTSYDPAGGTIKVEKLAGKLVITDKRPKASNGDNAHWTTSGTDWYKADWSNSNAKSTAPMDLSKYDFQADEATSTMRTANCYIIRHAGTYKIPLVYGNAIDFGKSGLTSGNNTKSYKPGGSGTTLGTFVNHTGYGIIDPYIENNTDDGQSKYYQNSQKNNDFIIASSAEVVWSEVSGLVTVDSDIRGTKKTQGAYSYSGGNYNSGDVRWIALTVSNTNIRQCNAVVAVKDASGNIMWSWHIWITNDPALDTAVSGGDFLPAPCIGWVEPSSYVGHDDIEIVLEQEESGETATVTVKQPEYENTYSNGTYYQWGRKDPMLSGQGTSAATKTLSDGILAPGTFFTAQTGTHWCSSNYTNLWTGTGSVKTVYDPSPVGYKVPSSTAYSSLGATNLVATGYDDRTSGTKNDKEGKYYWTSASNSAANGTSFKSSGAGNDAKSQGFAIRPVTE